MQTNLSFRVDEISRFVYPFVYWDDLFSKLEIKGILDYCAKNQEYEEARVMSKSVDEKSDTDSGTVDLDVRKSKIKMFNICQENQWIFEKLKTAGELVNNEFYRFDLTGFNYFQYTEYDESYKGKYDFHIDISLGNDAPIQMQISPRKLSMVLFLSDPKDYEGGQFEITMGKEAQVVEQKKGRVIGFPSWLMHRVKPVTKGHRKSLVYWICGPKFR